MIGVRRASPSRRADLGRRRVPVEHRHLAVHQHRGERLAPQRVDRLAAVGGDLDAVAAAAQDVDRDRLVGRVVLGEQDRRAALGGVVAQRRGAWLADAGASPAIAVAIAS